jgi:hypothetical protein
MSGDREIDVFDIVGIRADAAAREEEPVDRAVIPDGYELRFYGVHEPLFDWGKDPAERGTDVVLWKAGQLEVRSR